MEEVRRPQHVVLYVFGLAALVALVAAVSSWAAADPAPAQSTTPTQSIRYGESQTPEGDRSGRPPCPEDERGGQGGQQGGQGSDSTV